MDYTVDKSSEEWKQFEVEFLNDVRGQKGPASIEVAAFLGWRVGKRSLSQGVRIYDFVWPQNEHFKDECVYACSYTPSGPLKKGELFAVVHPSELPINSYLLREDETVRTPITDLVSTFKPEYKDGVPHWTPEMIAYIKKLAAEL